MAEQINCISLGYFCSVALELERIGLRSASYPFDWTISDFEGVIDAIENNFIHFLDYEYLYQNKEIHSHYRNKKYRISFFMILISTDHYIVSYLKSEKSMIEELTAFILLLLSRHYSSDI